jgi:hypothetical protein
MIKNQIGNHGGTSEGETSAIMIFMSPEFEEKPIFDNSIKYGKFIFPLNELI